MLKDLRDFLKSRVFFINLILMIVLFFGLIFGVRAYLDHYTLHGETITVPDLHGEELEQASKLLEKRDLNVVLRDSVHSDGVPPGAILTQDPEPERKVKKGRNIYLTVRAEEEEMVSMPDLEGRSRRHASSLLETVGLKVKDYQFEKDVCENCVLEQRYEGEAIDPGKRIPKGSEIVLVLGEGKGDEKTKVPDLRGLTIEASRKRLGSASLDLGTIEYEEGCCPSKEDSMSARVYGQTPIGWGDDRTVRTGSSVSIEVTTDSSRYPTPSKDTLSAQGEQE